MTEGLISIIVPIYNVAPHLEKCINSILNQTYKTLEIILVDDGSTDESGKICDEFAEKDDRIAVIHQKNGGITRARKAGTRASHGTYIGFVDGDDWIEPEMYDILYGDAKREGVPVVLSGMFRDNDSGSYAIWPATKCGTGLFENDRLHEMKVHLREWVSWSSVNKLFLAELVKEELEKVDDDLCGIEDDFFAAGCIARSESVFVEDKAFYHGYDRFDSATHTRHENYYLMMHRALSYYKQMMNYGDAGMKKELQRAYVHSLMNGINEVFPDIVFSKYYFENRSKISDKAKLVIYGAGAVGECFYQQLKANREIIWVDKNLKTSLLTGTKLNNISALHVIEYDYILIAVLDEKIAKEIRQELVDTGIIPKKIVWEKPRLVLEMLGL